MSGPPLFQRARTHHRLAWACLTVVQLFVVTAVPAAEAALERGDPMGVHLESEAAEGCALRHDHRFCQLCRVSDLDAFAQATSAGAAPCAPLARIALGPTPTALPGTIPCPTALGPRAPPGT